jgi:hypothetical protein
MGGDAITHLLPNMRMRMRVSTFRSVNRVGERFDFDGWFLLQTALIRRRQAEAKPNA